MKTDRAKRLRFKWLVIGLTVLSVMASIGFVREFLRSRQIDKQISDLQREAEALRAKNFEISSLQTSLANGEYLEREARLKLNLQKEGEHVVVIHTAGSDASGADAPTAEPEWSNAKKWWTYFTDRASLDAYERTRNATTQG